MQICSSINFVKSLFERSVDYQCLWEWGASVKAIESITGAWWDVSIVLVLGIFLIHMRGHSQETNKVLKSLFYNDLNNEWSAVRGAGGWKQERCEEME